MAENHSGVRTYRGEPIGCVRVHANAGSAISTDCLPKYSEGVWPVCSLKYLLKVVLELNPQSYASAIKVYFLFSCRAASTRNSAIR